MSREPLARRVLSIPPFRVMCPCGHPLSAMTEFALRQAWVDHDAHYTHVERCMRGHE